MMIKLIKYKASAYFISGSRTKLINTFIAFLPYKSTFIVLKTEALILCFTEEKKVTQVCLSIEFNIQHDQV